MPSTGGLANLLKKTEELAGAANRNKNFAYLGGSISKYTSNLVMTFPCMCDDSLSPSTASMISRANERNIVAMLQMLFTSMNISTAKDGIEVIMGLHNNIKTNYDIDDYIDTMDDFADRMNELSKRESVTLTAGDIAKIVTEMKKQMKEDFSFPIESLSEDTVNRFEISNTNGRITVREATPYNTSKKITTKIDKDGSVSTQTDDMYSYHNTTNPTVGDTPADLDYKQKQANYDKTMSDIIRADKKDK
jgi:hypothetical protein